MSFTNAVRARADLPGRLRLSAICALAAGIVFLAAAPARSGLVDLTPGTGSSGTINGAIYSFDNSFQGAGSGNLDSFLRIQNSPTEAGYNTSASPFAFDEKSGNFTHNIQASQLSTVTVNNVQYVPFLLDANESNGNGKNFLSLDQVKIYTSPTAPTNGNNPSNPDLLGTLRYDMDAGTNSTVLIDDSLSHGSGQSDMTLLVPVSDFSGVGANDYVFLYSEFGGLGDAFGKSWSSDGGFEEWAIMDGGTGLPPPVINSAPEPATLGLLTLGGLAFLVARKRRAA